MRLPVGLGLKLQLPFCSRAALRIGNKDGCCACHLPKQLQKRPGDALLPEQSSTQHRYDAPTPLSHSLALGEMFYREFF